MNRSLPAIDSILQTKNDPNDVKILFRVVHSVQTVLPAGLSFAERLQRGKYSEVVSDVNERNFGSPHQGFALSSDLPIEAVFALPDPKGESFFSTDDIKIGIEQTDFKPASAGIHLEVSNLCPKLEPRAAVFSLEAIAFNWRGHDGQKSVLATSEEHGQRVLSNYLFGLTRSWRRESLFLLWRSAA